MRVEAAARRLEFRDPKRAQALTKALASLCQEIGRPVSIMHVCGTHEQAIARFGLRSLLPEKLTVLMGPGCPVCVTDMPEVDEAVVLARQGVIVATFGDMFRVPGSVRSLAEVKAEGADVRVVYSPFEALRIARETEREVVFFATGFETTAVATAALVLASPPQNLAILSAHKYIPPVMEIVAEMPQTRVQGFLAAGHAATITGWRIFERFVARHRIPVVAGGFEPLDILAALAELLRLIRDGETRAVNAYPRCVTADGNRQAQRLLWEVFETEGGNWRGIAHVPNGNLRLRAKYAWADARRRFDIDPSSISAEARPGLSQECICGNIMAGIASPYDCRLFGAECAPQNPVGACMVSSEGTCKIWHEYGGHLSFRT
ncbi:MAG: hydrogenase formation protein HypD [Deltaproteobacteria bacterium]|nr:hydrogenase formation protein HypD [Deltaproteobacteria bacterium]